MSLDVYPRACYEHDYHWRYGVTVYGDKIPPSAANARFRAVIQMHSRFRAGSPMSYVRFTAVTLNGWRRSLFRRWKYVECPPEWRLVDPVVEI